MAKTSPTQRSLKHLRELGYHAAVVERWNQFAHIRQDLFNWVDIIAVHPQKGIIGVQTTTKDNQNARMVKARGNAALVAWLASGGFLHCHGWHKLKAHWVLNCKELTIADLAIIEESTSQEQ